MMASTSTPKIINLLLSRTANESHVRVSCNGQHSHEFAHKDVQKLPKASEFWEEPCRDMFKMLFKENTLAAEELKFVGNSTHIILDIQDKELLDVPWEFAWHDGLKKTMLACTHHVQRIVSPPVGPSQLNELSQVNPIHVIVIAPDPFDDPEPLESGGQWNSLADIAGQTLRNIKMELVSPPTLDNLRCTLSNAENAILCFIGHGGKGSRGSSLYFESDSGKIDAVYGEQLVDALKGHVHFALLSTCHSNQIAYALVENGIPLALGIIGTIKDMFAQRFTEAILDYIWQNLTIADALMYAREKQAPAHISILHTGMATIYSSNCDAHNIQYHCQLGILLLIQPKRKGNLALYLESGTELRNRQKELRVLSEYMTSEYYLDKELAEMDINIIQSIIGNDNGLDIKKVDKDNCTLLLLHYATKSCKIEPIKYLIENGWDINVVNADGQTAFCLAVENGSNSEVIQFLVKNGADVNFVSRSGYTALQWMAKINDIEAMKFLINNGADINLVNKYGETALYWVAENVNFEGIQILAEMGADINSVMKNGSIILHQVVKHGNMAAVQYLIEKGANININTMDQQGVMPLHIIAQGKTRPNLKLMQFLLDNGADITMTDGQGRTALHLVAENSGDIEAMHFLAKDSGMKTRIIDRTMSHYNIENLMKTEQILVKKGVDVNKMDNFQQTALHKIIKNEQGATIEAIKLLVKLGTSVQARDIYGRTALHYFAERKSIYGMEEMCIILAKWINVNATDNDRKTALHLLSANNANIKMVQYLVEKGADVNAMDKDQKTALHVIAANGTNMEAIRYLIEKGARVDMPDVHGKTMLHVIMGNGNEIDMTVLHFLLKRGADVNSKDNEGESVLHAAASHQKGASMEAIRCLVENGADVNSKDSNGRTVLHFAAKNLKGADMEVIRFLVEKGADVNAKCTGWVIEGMTALHFAAINSKGADMEVIRFLVEKGADVNAKCTSTFDEGKTALHFAAGNKKGADVEVIRFLVEKGADVNVTEEREGKTVLHYAAGNSNGADVEVIRFLVEKGADVNVTDQRGRTALHFAASNSKGADVEVIRFLVENGADVNAKDESGDTPLEVLEKRHPKNQDVVRILEALKIVQT